ncbi:zinc finger protein 345 [Drosophila sechellia]|uniref:GM26057 n=1 Tax=Drosophila sechellia TaxID=7238 RepID=B4HHJ6_DROSE|nr:zinc finger protein 345 [Drosophila sechellia]EDW42535.1 GM26057 [Drosophila sechellia]
MDTADIHVNISSQTCRVCLETHETNLYIHDEIKYNDLVLELRQLLEAVSKLKWTWTHPNLPMHLCQNCARRLIGAYEFIVEVENAHETLQNLFEQQEVAAKTDEVHVDVVELIDQDDVVSMEQYLSTSFAEQHVEMEAEYGDQDCPAFTSDVSEDRLYTSEDRDNEPEDPTQLKPLPDETENKEFSRPSQLGSRLNHSENFIYKCAVCPRVFAKSESLTRHFSQAHKLTADVAAMKLANESCGTGLLTCEHCPRTFKRQDTLRRHMQAFHPDAIALEPEETTENSARKRIAKRRDCPHCGLSFPVSSLTIHIRRHTGDNPYKCDQCEKAFPRSQDLSLHMRQHTGERPSECKICCKKFISQNKLARHMRLHTGQRPYSCKMCSKSFVQSNDLKIHMRRHTGERPYQCVVCGESFVCGSHLNIHRNRKGHLDAVIPGNEVEANIAADPYVNTRVNQRRSEDIERMRLQRIPENQLQQRLEMLPKPDVPAMCYKCGVCQQKFKSGALLTVHRNKMSHYEIERVYENPLGKNQKMIKPEYN